MAKDEKKIDMSNYEQNLEMMATEDFHNDLLALLKSRSPLIFLTCSEEKRLKDYFKYLSAVRGYKTFVWDCYLGCIDLLSGQKETATTTDLTIPEEMLTKIIGEAEKDISNAKFMKNNGISGNIYILLDFHRWIEPDVVTPEIERRLKTFASINSMTHIIMTGPSFRTSTALENSMSVVDFPYPNDLEIKKALWGMVKAVEKQGKLPNLKKETQKNENTLIKSVSGLTLVEAQMAYAKSLVLHKKFVIPSILKEKRQIIRKKGTLEFLEPKVSMGDVGGLDNLVDWLKLRLLAFHPDALDYGIPCPKGVLAIGCSGTGKSLCAKAVASLYQMPLLRLDFGRLFGSLQGESEERSRGAIALAEVVSPCILWLDEIEKGLSGGKSSGQTDGGTTNRVISTFLTWMEEKEKPVFVFATANDYTQLPPEFMRRFDEIFFVDLPNINERKSIFKVLLRRYKRDEKNFDIDCLAVNSDGYSGAEIEKAIVSALFVGFSESSRAINTKDILLALKSFKPLSVMRSDVIDEMRSWAKDSCVMANRKLTDSPGFVSSNDAKQLEI